MTAAKWRALAPAIDPRYYPIELIQHISESLPSADVRITKFDQSARQVAVEGEANSAALAYQFADKVKKKRGLANVSIRDGGARGYCRTITRSFAWRENRDDARLVSADEPA